MLNEAEPDYLSDYDANLTIVLAALGICIQRVQRFRNAPLKVNPETSDLYIMPTKGLRTVSPPNRRSWLKSSL